MSDVAMSVPNMPSDLKVGDIFTTPTHKRFLRYVWTGGKRNAVYHDVELQRWRITEIVQGCIKAAPHNG